MCWFSYKDLGSIVRKTAEDGIPCYKLMYKSVLEDFYKSIIRDFTYRDGETYSLGKRLMLVEQTHNPYIEEGFHSFDGNCMFRLT